MVEPQSPQALADAIEYLISNPVIIRDLALNAQAKAFSEFSIEKMAGEYQHVFNSIGNVRTFA
ncbi:hypothetical protein [Paraglaciecola sp.]|uniref:glycosyltransferase n=1 Tax=Paraglaciecola sp. TaxID=1920173 RepID=UPI0030F3923D